MKEQTKRVAVPLLFPYHHGEMTQNQIALHVAEDKSPAHFATAWFPSGLVAQFPEILKRQSPTMCPVYVWMPKQASINVDGENLTVLAPVFNYLEERGWTMTEQKDTQNGRDWTWHLYKNDSPYGDYHLILRFSLTVVGKSQDCIRVRDYRNDYVVEAYRWVCPDDAPEILK